MKIAIRLPVHSRAVDLWSSIVAGKQAKRNLSRVLQGRLNAVGRKRGTGPGLIAGLGSGKETDCAEAYRKQGGNGRDGDEQGSSARGPRRRGSCLDDPRLRRSLRLFRILTNPGG